MFEFFVLTGYTGDQCDQDINECESTPCLQNSTCVDLPNGYRCECQPGTVGSMCELTLDACSSHPCHHNGQCQSKDFGANFTCTCRDGFEGDLCEINIDECASSPCQNGGKCIDRKAHFECVCPLGMVGHVCEHDVDDCAPNPCEHLEATCVDRTNDFQCLCPPGFAGSRCELEMDECLSQPCVGNATCMDRVNGYLCKCPPGLGGINCDIDLDECNSSPCQHGGMCTDLLNEYKCHCLLGYTGKKHNYESIWWDWAFKMQMGITLEYTSHQAYKKCSVCLGPSKVMGKIFCHMCMKHTSQVHSVKSLSGVQARGHFDALWCNLHLCLNLFCVNIIFFSFQFWTFSAGSIFFFWDLRFHGPVDFVGLPRTLPT